MKCLLLNGVAINGALYERSGHEILASNLLSLAAERMERRLMLKDGL